MTASIELTVAPHPDDSTLYCARWADGEPLLTHVPEPFLDLVGFMLARKLLEQGYNVEHLLIVRLHGADHDLMRALLGAAAAPPLVNHAAPVREPARVMHTGLRHG